VLLIGSKEDTMPLVPIVFAFALALAGALALGFRPGYPFGPLLFGATIVAAMSGIAASVLQFLPQRYFVLFGLAAGTLLGLLVTPLLGVAETLEFGEVRGAVAWVWPIALVAALLWSRALGMRLPALRRRRHAAPRV
jgi:hypothetical protein